MSKLTMVLADTNEDYLSALEYRFLVETGDNVDLLLFSDGERFREFFSEPQTVDVALISEELYDPQIGRHNIAHLFVLADDASDRETQNLAIKRIFKYKNTKEIFFEATEGIRDRIRNGVEEEGTKLIAFYAPSGGVGKTALSLAFASELAAMHQNTLYVNAETLQNFQTFFSNPSPLGTDGIHAILQNKKAPFTGIRPFLHHEGFDYLPPVIQIPGAWGLTEEIYGMIAQGAVESGTYQQVIIDLESGLTQDRIQIMEKSDQVMIVTNISRTSIEKMRIFLDNIQMPDTGKYTLLINGYTGEDDVSELLAVVGDRLVRRKIVVALQAEPETLADLSQIREIRELVYVSI